MGIYDRVDGLLSDAVFTGFEKALGKPLSVANNTRGLPCVDSPTPIVLGLSSYLTVVLGGLICIKVLDLKPRAKEPAVLQAYVLFHNALCFALSLYMCVGIVGQAIFNGYVLWGNAYNPREIQMSKLIYMFYMSKYVEFMDTVIMVMKRNIRQITVLHIYHHASISFIWWIIAYHAPGGEAYFSAALNSGVHVIMYLYYLLAASLGKDEKIRRKYLWWGKYLTQIQMFQFCLNLVEAYINLKNRSPYPRFLIQILFYYMISLLALFANFYVHRYHSPSAKSDKSTPQKVKKLN